jgi:hypothetical protein
MLTALVEFVHPLLGVDLKFIAVCTVGALGPSHGVPLVAGSFFSSSGFASSGKSGAFGGTGVAGEAKTVESGDKTLARVYGVSRCFGD